MKLTHAFVIAGLLFSGHVHSESEFWRDGSGKPVQETESMKSKDGFAGSLLATIDENWEEKWNTPPEIKPSFNKVDAIHYGKKIFILSFFANPKRDSSGNVDVKLDIKIIDPNGRESFTQQKSTCYAGRIAGDLYNLYLCVPVVKFSGDPGDPVGVWVVEVNLRDVNRNLNLPLRTSFRLQ